MKTLIPALLILASGSAFAKKPQICTGTAERNGKPVSVQYTESAGEDEIITDILLTVGESNISISSKQVTPSSMVATINVAPVDKGNIVIAKRESQEVLIILQQDGQDGTLTYSLDQSGILSNTKVTCVENSDF